jgi:hypothetical protein
MVAVGLFRLFNLNPRIPSVNHPLILPLHPVILHFVLFGLKGQPEFETSLSTIPVNTKEKKMKLANYRLSKHVFFIFLVIALLGASLSIGDTESRSRSAIPSSVKARLADHEAVLKKDPSNYQHLKEAGILASELSRDNPKTYAPKAVDYLTRAHDLNKQDDETLCHLGSAVTMMARTTMNPLKKSGYANRGCGYMDKAVRRSPDNIAVRMTRGCNSMALPGFLNRRSFAFEDFAYLAQRFEKEPQLPAVLKSRVYKNLAELYRRTKETAKAEKYDRLASAQQALMLPDRTSSNQTAGNR